MIYQDMRQIRRDVALIDRVIARSNRNEARKFLINFANELSRVVGWIALGVIAGYFILRILMAPAHAETIMPVAVAPRGYDMSAIVTAYSSSVDETDSTPFITASGAHVGRGTLACPPEYAFGTRVEIEGQGYVCQDRMNDKYNDRFDVWVGSKNEAYAWGKKDIHILVLFSI